MRIKAYCPACLESAGRLSLLSPIMGCEDPEHLSENKELYSRRQWPTLEGILIAPKSQSRLRRFLPNSDKENWDFLPLRDLNILFGPNGTGKTSFLRLLWAAMSLDCSPVEGFIFRVGHQLRRKIGRQTGNSTAWDVAADLQRQISAKSLEKWEMEGLILVTTSLPESNWDLFSFSDKMQSPRKIEYLPVIKKGLENAEFFLLEAQGIDPLIPSKPHSETTVESDLSFSNRNAFVDESTCPFWLLPKIDDAQNTTELEEALRSDVGCARDDNLLKVELVSCLWDYDYPSIYDFAMPEDEEFLPRGAEGISLRLNLAIFCRSFSEEERVWFLEELAKTAGRIFPNIRKLSIEEGDFYLVASGSHPRLIVNDMFDDQNLSRAQARIISLLVHSMVASYRPGYRAMLIDDIELGLNRQAESSLARLLPELTSNPKKESLIQNRLIFVSTQSPEVMLAKGANVLLFSEGEIRPLQNLSGDLDRFGLRPVDIFGSLSAFVVVEGEHDEAFLSALDVGQQDLDRVSVVKGRGAKNFPGIFDTQILFKFTQAPILVVVDNFRTSAVSKLVDKFRNLEPNSSNVAEFKSKLTKHLPHWQSGENRFIGDLLLNAFEHSQLQRLNIFGLSKPDIIMYLPESAFGLGETWDLLHSRWSSEKSQLTFKDWLRIRYGARISTPKIATAARQLTQLDEDLSRLLTEIRSY